MTATGSDETLAAIRARLPVKTRFLGYGHRVSFGFVAHEVLSGFHARQIVSRTTDDVVAWNQLGCLSPHVVYVQTGGEVSPEKFAELLADELERREQTEPRGELPAEHAAAIASRRGIYEVRAAHSPETTQHWCSRDSTAWTVVYEADARFQLSCLNRFIYVKPVRDLARRCKMPKRCAARSRPSVSACRNTSGRNWRRNWRAGARRGCVRWAGCKTRR